MPKKQKNKRDNNEKRNSRSFPSNSATHVEPSASVISPTTGTIIPSTSTPTAGPSTSSTTLPGLSGLIPKKMSQRTSNLDAMHLVDGKYAVVHWSDARKMGLRHGDPALIILTPPDANTAMPGTNDDDTSDDGYIITTVCNIRISPSDPSHSDISKGLGRRSSFSRRENSTSLEKAACGNILLSADIILPNGASIRQPEEISHFDPITPASNASYSSPSKSAISFKKGGAGESLLSLTTPTKYISPSGSKFSFSKGGGGESLLSPGLTKSSMIPSNNNSQCTKSTSSNNVLVVVPLRNLSSHQLGRLCPEAHTIQICPAKDSDKTCNETELLDSSAILQTLIISKYEGAYFQARGDDRKLSSSSSILETISVPFRGLTRYFQVARVTPVPVYCNDVIDQSDDRQELATHFDQLEIADNVTAATEDESRFLGFLQCRNRQSKQRGGCAVACKVSRRTKIDFLSSIDALHSTTTQTVENPHHTSSDHRRVCAGLDSTLIRINDVLLPPLLHPNLFPSDGPLRPPKGALLYGPAGVGKSLLAVQIADDLSRMLGRDKIHVQMVSCADITSSTAIVGQAEKLLSNIFDEAENKATNSGGGSLIILDDVHLICPRRGGMSSSTVDQLAGTLLALLDGIGGSQTNSSKTCGGRLIVLAITTDPSTLDPALRRPGRLDVEIEVSVPDDKARADIIKFHLLRLMTDQQIREMNIDALARLAKGFTGADCKMAVKEAVRIAMSRMLRGDDTYKSGNDIDTQRLLSIHVQYSDLEHAIRMTKPSAIKSVAVEVPSIPWSAIGGMDDVKALLKESIELPLTHPHLFEMMQVPPPKGILLYGPPGCSKTLCARAIATEGNMNFLAVKGPELLSKWLGESERALASLFRRARLAAPAVIFFDELDSLASARGDGGSGSDRLLSQLLTELDGVTSGGKGERVVVVGATNRPDVLDTALTRPGRMDRMIYVGLPDEKGRTGIFEIGLAGKDCHEDVDILVLASDDVSKGYSGAEIIAICRDAALHAIGDSDEGKIQRPQIHMKHLLQSVNEMTPRTTASMLQFYDSFRGRH